MFVLDTNTVIYFFKGQGRVAAHLAQVAPQEVALPSVVVYELQVGIARSGAPEKRQAQLATFTTVVRVLPFGVAEAAQAALIRADLERRGLLIGPYDILIAATTLVQQATLVTHNREEFSRIPALSLADWY